MDDPCENKKLNNKICNVKIEMNEAIFALESDNEDSNNENPNTVKNNEVIYRINCVSPLSQISCLISN